MRYTLLLALLTTATTAQAPLLHWRHGAAGTGPAPTVAGGPVQVHEDAGGSALFFDGEDDALVLTEDAPRQATLPARAMTVAAWVAVNTPLRWGGIANVVRDNGGAEAGWVLGFDEEHFTFGLATRGADDGDGTMTYLVGRTPYRLGRWHHVVATYDGRSTRLFVNGERQASTRQQSGDILYPVKTPFVIGNYRDDDESHFLHGRLREVTLWDRALDDIEITSLFTTDAGLVALDAVFDRPPAIVVAPYLQRVATDGITVMWETTQPMRARVEFGAQVAENEPLAHAVDAGGEHLIHEVRVTGLEPDTTYFYRAVSTAEDGTQLLGDVHTFQTAVRPGQPFVFAVIGDTQAQPKVVKVLADRIFAQRPHFVVHAGDLVTTGTDKQHWTQHFFPNMQPLIARVAFMPVLGNHEQNASHYYRYMSLPEPEYYYEWRYGNSHWFMLDTNKPVGPDSEQYQWLDRALARSDAQWKFAVHHHPIWSSDENDHGDTAKGGSTWGNLNARNLEELYSKHGVDVVWNGHIHVYERTWPLLAGKVVDKGGVVYVTSGGGGGSLEDFAPTKPAFSNTVMRGHHHCTVAINGGALQFKAFDLDGRLFDTFTLQK